LKLKFPIHNVAALNVQIWTPGNTARLTFH
jgi:hypothetical protein